MKGIWQLEVEEGFAAAHALRHYEGKCERLHGHNFTVAIGVQGSELDGETEILIDFKLLKNMLKEILDGLDHHVLNDLPIFMHANPSSENLARHIWERMEEKLAALPRSATLAYVRVSEKPGQSATYRMSA